MPYEVPEGWKELDIPPEGLTKACVGKFVLYKWNDWGWALGKIVKYNAPSSRLGKKYNFQVSYATDADVGSRAQNLEAERHGITTEDAPAGSWQLVGCVQAAK